jgi:hypothetical protein
MGRWAQRRVRGGGGEPAVRPLTLLDVLVNGTTYVVLRFIEDENATDAPSSTQLQIDASTCDLGGSLSPRRILVYTDHAIHPGDQFQIDPAGWLDNPYFPPTVGLCIEGPLQDTAVAGVLHEDATHLRISFTEPVLVTTAPTTDTAFSFNGVPATDVTQDTPRDVIVAVAGAAAKTTWAVTGQPAWLRNGLLDPFSGDIL